MVRSDSMKAEMSRDIDNLLFLQITNTRIRRSVILVDQGHFKIENLTCEVILKAEVMLLQLLHK